MKLLTTVCLACCLASCQALGIETVRIPTRQSQEPEISATEAARESDAKLYARDGSVVSGNPRGSVTSAGELGHDLQPTNGGRMYILELYQKVIDERDGLQMEVNALRVDNERRRQALEETERKLAVVHADYERMLSEKQGLVDENLELASRLTTAQIRRLEVERLLLESRIREAQLSVAVEPESGP